MTRARSGFTLLEMLVALVVLGFLFAGLSQAIRFETVAFAMGAGRSTRAGDLETVDRTLRRLLGRMDPGQPLQPALLRAEPHTLVFATELPDAAGTLAAVRAEVSLGLDHARLVLRWRALLAAGPAAVTELTLAQEVATVDFGYWSRARGVWLPRWNDADAVPDLVRVAITFGDRSRHWPMLVIAPMRNRSR